MFYVVVSGNVTNGEFTPEAVLAVFDDRDEATWCASSSNSSRIHQHMVEAWSAEQVRDWVSQVERDSENDSDGLVYTTGVISPKQQLRNVAKLVIERTEPSRESNGRGRMSSYKHSKHEIASTSRQLAEMVLAYLDGELGSLPDDGSPF